MMRAGREHGTPPQRWRTRRHASIIWMMWRFFVKSLQTVVQRHVWSLLMLLIAGAFALLLVELIVTEHTDGIQLVGVGASAIGLILAGLSLVAPSSWRRVLAVLFLALSLTGVIGVVEHQEARNKDRREAALVAPSGNTTVRIAQGRQEGGGRGERFARPDGGESAPPPLAPLSLAGASLMAAVLLLGRSDAVTAAEQA